MQKLQIYIDGQRADMFEEISVTITDTLKNVKDVSKVFTEFSQTFSLPASKTNNKIFKHYYNSDIQNGFDARIRATAKIELNSIPYKDGYVKLEGVDLRNNNPHTYRITFFGNTVSLKNLLGDDLLSSLGSVPEGKINLFEEFSKKIDGTDLLYGSTDIETYLTTQVDRTVDGVVYSAPIQVPLLTHSQRLYYDSDNGHVHDELNSGNLHYDSATSHRHGVKFNELKYALKLSVIIKAIEEKYGLNFSSDFFKGGDNSFIDLYMWLHRKKGSVISEDGLVEYPKTVDGWVIDNGDASSMINSFTILLDNYIEYGFVDDFDLTLTRTTTEPYSVSVLRNGSQVYSESNITQTLKIIDLKAYAQNSAEYTVVLTYSNAITFTNIEWYFKWSNEDYTSIDSFSTGEFELETEYQFSISQQIPKMKVLDFLTSIFKMFNLVAYIEGGIVVVKDLDTFYANQSPDSPYDITKYIDVNSSTIDSALPFREVDFSYKGLKTFLAKKHEQLFDEEWGTEEYSGEDSTILSSSIFKVEVPFEHMKFERLIDSNTSGLTDIQYGYSVDDNQQSYIGQPLVFYIELKTLPTTPIDKRISFVDAVNTVNNVPNVATSHIPISSYYTPANSDLKYSQLEDRQSIHFSPEQDEWELTTTNETLFNNYHKNYISSVFNQSNRLTKVTAYLPLRILLKYTLADRFVIAGKSYKINSIETDFYTGKTELELLNDI